MRVLYFAYEGFDTPNGTNHLAIKLIDYLLNQGFEVDLLTSHTKGEFDDIPDVLRGRERFRFDIVPRTNVGKLSFLKRYLLGIKYAYDCKKIWKKKKDKIDIVILQSTQTAFFSSRLLKRCFKGKVIFNSYDVFPNVAYDSGAIKNKLLYRILLKMQKALYKNCDSIVVISSDMKKTLMKQGVPDKKIVEIRNWFDDSKVGLVPADSNQFIKKYNVDTKKFYVQYAGNFGITFNYKYVIEVARLLLGFDDIVFQMIGSGAFEEQFKEEAKAYKNIEFYPWQPLEIISDVYSACNVELIPLSKGVINNSFPSKGSLLMACGKAIMCATETGSDYYKSINESGAGICVSNTDPEEAAKKILELYNDREMLNKLESTAKEFGFKNYSSSVCLPKFKELLNEMVNNQEERI